ncbi:MAG TPA: hypothetical protein VEB21_02970 [Terriglobales bacterium]|nr:hypothetical protein [Terriglobales bacterium]
MSFVAAIAAIFAGCTASMPRGPRVVVLPGDDKQLEEFRADDFRCRQWGADQVAAEAEATGGWPQQQDYDVAYIQCMYAAGHQVPMAAPLDDGAGQRHDPRIPPPPPGDPPPPPPGVE